MALSEDKQRTEKEGRLQSFKVAASTVIYKGALVKVGADGFLAPQAAEAGAVHAGVAYEACDNSAGADGEKSVRVETGRAFNMNGSGFAQADVGKAAYASDDDTVSVTQGANELKVGKIIEVLSATEVLVLQSQFADKGN